MDKHDTIVCDLPTVDLGGVPILEFTVLILNGSSEQVVWVHGVLYISCPVPFETTNIIIPYADVIKVINDDLFSGKIYTCI